MVNITQLLAHAGPLLHGAALSLCIAGSALCIGFLGGTLLGIAILYGPKLLRLLCNAYITLIRGTPMLIQIMALFFILPSLGITLSALWSAILAIGLNSAAYISQIIRAGIQAVGKGQVEAAQTLGFTQAQTIRLIILPQAFRTILPALGNECITLIKDSSLASVIGVAELTHQGSILMSRTYDAVTAYAGVACIYLIMTTIATCLLHLLERKLQYVKH